MANTTTAQLRSNSEIRTYAFTANTVKPFRAVALTGDNANTGMPTVEVLGTKPVYAITSCDYCFDDNAQTKGTITAVRKGDGVAIEALFGAVPANLSDISLDSSGRLINGTSGTAIAAILTKLATDTFIDPHTQTSITIARVDFK
jgi:hypothetical protein